MRATGPGPENKPGPRIRTRRCHTGATQMHARQESYREPRVTRAEAKATGAIKFFSGQPCPHGHITERYTSNSLCVVCALAASKAQRLSLLPSPTRLPPEVCECCGGPPNGAGALHLDHDHDTGEFRGWLCMGCNMSIGQLGDNLEGLQRAIEYLKREK